MTIVWTVRIHKLVLSEDFKSISHPEQAKILKDIRKKLTVDPYSYGKPLTGELKGYFRLRVGDYRVIYRIKEDTIEVLVIKVGIRRDDEAYRDLFYRLKKLQAH